MDSCETTHLAKKIRYHARVMDLTIKRLTGCWRGGGGEEIFRCGGVFVVFFFFATGRESWDGYIKVWGLSGLYM